MRYHIPTLVAILSLTVCSACISSGDNVAKPQEQSLASSERKQLSSVEDEQFSSILHMILEWAPTLTWSSPMEGTNDNSIHRGDTEVIEPGMIKTTSVHTTISRAEYEKIFQGVSPDALDDIAQARGLTVYPKLDADGVLGTQWGYEKQSSEGSLYLIISVTGKKCVESSDAPPLCTLYEAKVSMTSLIRPDETYDR